MPIRTTDIRTQVLTTARNDELAVAAGNNALISKSEQQVLAADLQGAAEEVRRREPGKTVSVDDVVNVFAEQVDTAIGSVNQQSGSGKAFLSKDEVRNLVAREPLIGGRVQRAYDILAMPATPSKIVGTGAEVYAQLSAALGAPTGAGRGFFFDGLLGSEGGEPVVAIGPKQLSSTSPSGDELARAFGHDTSTDQGAVERFKAADPALIKEFLDNQPGASAADIAKVGGLLRGLENLRVLVVGKDGAAGVDANHPTYIVGAASDGLIVGLKTGVIWT